MNDDDQPKDLDSAEHDDGCLVAGTLVETIDGPKLIESIRVCDLVHLAPSGRMKMNFDKKIDRISRQLDQINRDVDLLNEMPCPLPRMVERVADSCHKIYGNLGEP